MHATAIIIDVPVKSKLPAKRDLKPISKSKARSKSEPNNLAGNEKMS